MELTLDRFPNLPSSMIRSLGEQIDLDIPQRRYPRASATPQTPPLPRGHTIRAPLDSNKPPKLPLHQDPHFLSSFLDVPLEDLCAALEVLE